MIGASLSWPISKWLISSKAAHQTIHLYFRTSGLVSKNPVFASTPTKIQAKLNQNLKNSNSKTKLIFTLKKSKLAKSVMQKSMTWPSARPSKQSVRSSRLLSSVMLSVERNPKTLTSEWVAQTIHTVRFASNIMISAIIQRSFLVTYAQKVN